jgi:hypothetical protein
MRSPWMPSVRSLIGWMVSTNDPWFCYLGFEIFLVKERPRSPRKGLCTKLLNLKPPNSRCDKMRGVSPKGSATGYEVHNSGTKNHLNSNIAIAQISNRV